MGNCGKGMLGRHHTPETRAKMSMAAQGRRPPPKAIAKSIAARRGKSLSLEHRAKLSEAGKRHPGNMLGKKLSQETRLKMSLAAKGKPKLYSCKHTPETKAKMSKTRKGRAFSPEHRHNAMIANGAHRGLTHAEKEMETILAILFPGEYRFCGHGQVIIGNKIPDFININGQKKLIEVFGDYWHRGDDPTARIRLFRQYGFETLVVWERELLSEDKQPVLDSLFAFHNTLD